jgi:hypothetical protein
MINGWQELVDPNAHSRLLWLVMPSSSCAAGAQKLGLPVVAC